MNVMRYSAKDLRSMTLKALEETGRQLGLDFTKNHNRAERAKRILAKYAEQDLATPPLGHTSGELSPSPVQGSPKPAFEALIDGEAADVEDSPPRGGARPGAGRPEGMTEEIAQYNRLSKQPHPAVKQALEMIFETWAVRTKCREIALTKEEAFDIALPWTNALELMGVTRHIPPWLMVVLSCIWTTANLIKCKAALAREAAKARLVAQAAANPSQN